MLGNTIGHDRPSPSASCGCGTPSFDDREFAQACAEFDAADAALGRLTESDGPSEQDLFVLHQRWAEACRRCADLWAGSAEGQRTKARILLRTLHVVLGRLDEALPHELLAISLAQDLLNHGNVTSRQTGP